MQSFTLVSGLMALGSAAAASFGNATITPSSTVAPTGPTAGVDVTTTVIEVTELTTFCPAPTQITTNGKTITVTAPGTITITDCPCKKTTTVPVPTPNVPVPVKGNDTIVWTTEIVPVLTTFCPAPTEFTQGTKTYTVTKPTTLTITDCPCTISRPVPKPTVVPSFNGTANATTIFTTQTVATLTTFCPAPTTLTNVGTVPIPVLTPGTITVSNQCPCTVVTPIATQPVPVAPQSNPAGNPPAGNTPVAPTSPNSPNTQNGATNRPSSIATGGAGSVGSSIMAWIAAAAFAVAA